MKRYVTIIAVILAFSAVTPVQASGVIVDTIRSHVQAHVQQARDQHAQNQDQQRQAPKAQQQTVVEQLLRSVCELVGLGR